MSDKKEKTVKGYAQQTFMLRGREYNPGDVVECEASKMDELTDDNVRLVGSSKPNLGKTKEAKGGKSK